MIIIKVQGGLGNQMLQYSIGRVLATVYDKDVSYDLSFFDNQTKYTKRPYLLDKFKANVRIATKEEIYNTKYPYGIFSKASEVFFRACNKYIFKKYYVGYDPSFFNTVSKKDSLYLEGFWQSFEYYKNSLKLLSEELTLKDDSSVKSLQEKLSFGEKKSVAVHIRRGDYVNFGKDIQVLSQEYYKQAVLLLEKKVEASTYFIFSDDIKWVKETMGNLFSDAVYVSLLNLTDYEEFSLMKDCNYAIIANSTFSWFSAVLSYTSKKVVIYPKDWKNKYLLGDTHICPKEWFGI